MFQPPGTAGALGCAGSAPSIPSNVAMAKGWRAERHPAVRPDDRLYLDRDPKRRAVPNPDGVGDGLPAPP